MEAATLAHCWLMCIRRLTVLNWRLKRHVHCDFGTSVTLMGFELLYICMCVCVCVCVCMLLRHLKSSEPRNISMGETASLFETNKQHRDDLGGPTDVLKTM